MPPTPALGFLRDPALIHVADALLGAGHDALVVGGAARDGLMGRDPSDIDLATDARPAVVADLLARAGVEVRPTGLAHGTLTAVHGGQAFEITTFRRDVSTDGRRATVAFASTFEEDAARRDFTINALGLRMDGSVVDPTGQGLDDLAHGRLRFVGDGHTRCAEDALRALRLFRFQARFGSWPMLEASLDAAAKADLSPLSGERVWSEMKGILVAPQAVQAVEAMVATGVAQRLLPHTRWDVGNMARVAAREDEAGLPPSWAARLAAATGRTSLPWPLSGHEARGLALLDKHRAYAALPAAAAAASGRADVARGIWALGTAPVPPQGVEQEVARGLAAVLPLTAAHLMAQGHTQGKALGQALDRARRAWLESDCTAPLEALHPSAGGKVQAPSSHKRDPER